MKTSNKTILWLVGVVMLVALGAAMLFWSFTQIEKAAEERNHIALVINSAENLLSGLQDAETGQRGYLLTNDEAFLAPYYSVHDDIKVRLDTLNRLTAISAAKKHLTPLAALVDKKMAELSYAIELNRKQDNAGALAAIRRGAGKLAMDSIRAELASFIKIEAQEALQLEAAFQSNMRRLLSMIVIASLFALLSAIAFVILMYRETQQRLKNLVHTETRHLLEVQETLNTQLQDANATLLVSEEKLGVTLNSIGDAVIATDACACITLLNPVAEHLTGWTQAQALGHPVDEVFHIINKDTRQFATIPVADALAHGTIQGLANHTVLIARDGREFDIADSCAPIRDLSNQVVGAVLVFRNVTEEYAIQQSLRDSAELVQTVLNTVEDGIITLHANDGVIDTVNPAAEAMFGYTGSEIIGQNFSLLIPELDQSHQSVGLDHYSASEEARISGIGREVMGRRKDGSTFPLELAATEMKLKGQRYFTGVLRDLSTRSQAKEALIKAGALQNAIFNSANFSSIATDAKGVIQIFNVGAERMLGYEAADVMNKITPADISDPQEVIARAQALSDELDTPITPGFEALVFKASRGIEDIYELTYIRKDGSRFPAVVSVTALRDAQEAIIGYLLIGTDNTARKRVEAERAQLDKILQDKNVELEAARALAERANLAKSDFLSSMSHELRTPLGAILGFAQLMETGLPQPTPSQKRSIDQILKAGWYLLELINEILDLALIESGKMTLSIEPVSLTEILQECEAMIEPQAKKRNIKLVFTPSKSPYYVQADRMRVKQVLINLLSNAIKYNKVGGTVAVACTQCSSGLIRTSVLDTGHGLAPDQLVQLFQPFNRLGQKAKDEEGTGIGLVVCKRLVELMSGEIGFESKVGEGSVFWFELCPTTQEGHNSTLQVQPSAATPLQVEASDHLHTLLYVEDNPANLMLVEDLMARRPDIRLLSARDGNSGVEIAQAWLPDVILMDINLPGISGLKALSILAADPATAHIPVIALSANAIPRDIAKGLEAGFFRYLTKPIKVIEFLNTLDLALKSTQTQVADTALKDTL